MRGLFLVALWSGCASGPIVVSVAEYDPIAQRLGALGDGAEVHLQIPPQGGVVLFIGARANGMDDATVELRARLTVNGALVGEDRRTSKFARASDGSYAPALDSSVAMANVPVCPAGGLVALEVSSSLEVEIVEADSSRSGRAVVQVVPRCAQPDAVVNALCRCECAAEFVPGHC